MRHPVNSTRRYFVPSPARGRPDPSAPRTPEALVSTDSQRIPDFNGDAARARSALQALETVLSRHRRTKSPLLRRNAANLTVSGHRCGPRLPRLHFRSAHLADFSPAPVAGLLRSRGSRTIAAWRRAGRLAGRVTAVAPPG